MKYFHNLKSEEHCIFISVDSTSGNELIARVNDANFFCYNELDGADVEATASINPKKQRHIALTDLIRSNLIDAVETVLQTPGHVYIDFGDDVTGFVSSDEY